MSRPTTAEEYLSTFGEPALSRLRELVALCRDAAPETDERIKWGSPAYVHADGVILFMLSGHKHHAAVVFTPSTKEAFDAELAELAGSAGSAEHPGRSGIETGKGSVKIPYGTEIPTDLLRRMIGFRIREHEVDGVNWM